MRVPTEGESGRLARLVLEYLSAAEAREIDRAVALLADEVEIVFPGGERYSGLPELVTAAAGRYRRVRKTHRALDVDAAAGTVVINGVLDGENLHGVGFANVRYVDRFEIHDGSIVRQDVWNDLTESGVLTATEPGQLAERYRPA